MSKYFPIIFVLLLFFVSCKQVNRDDNDNESYDIFSDHEIAPERNMQEIVEIEMSRDIAEDRSRARDELLEIIAADPKLPYFLVGSYYHVDHIIEGEKPMDVLEEGIWYHFSENFTFDHGNIEGNYSKGRYAYKEHTNMILLFPDDYNSFPEEWKILHSDDMVIFAGTSKFGNNNVQKRMIRVKKRPGLVD